MSFKFYILISLIGLLLVLTLIWAFKNYYKKSISKKTNASVNEEDIIKSVSHVFNSNDDLKNETKIINDFDNENNDL